MQDIIVGLLAVTIGGIFCVRGYVAMRTLIPLWGTFAGFLFGAGLIDATTDDGFLRSALAWLVGLGFAIVFGALAYLYYEVSIVLAMSAVGFALGVSVTGVLDTAQLDQGTTTERIEDDWWWYAGYLALAVVGVVTQVGAARHRTSPRDQWSSAGGRQLRGP